MQLVATHSINSVMILVACSQLPHSGNFAPILQTVIRATAKPPNQTLNSSLPPPPPHTHTLTHMRAVVRASHMSIKTQTMHYAV